MFNHLLPFFCIFLAMSYILLRSGIPPPFPNRSAMPGILPIFLTISIILPMPPIDYSIWGSMIPFIFCIN